MGRCSAHMRLAAQGNAMRAWDVDAMLQEA